MPKNSNKVKTEKADEIVAPKKDIANEDISSENESLKKQMEEMKAQMEAMSKMLAEAKSAPVAEKSGVNKDRNITFVNLTNGTAVLRGNSFWKLEGRFASRTFLEREARIIVNNHINDYILLALRNVLIYIYNVTCIMVKQFLQVLITKDIQIHFA